jgi:hypothetical protein
MKDEHTAYYRIKPLIGEIFYNKVNNVKGGDTHLKRFFTSTRSKERTTTDSFFHENRIMFRSAHWNIGTV